MCALSAFRPQVGADIRTVEEQVVLLLGEQTTAEKSGSKAAGDVRALRKRMREEELAIAGTQNELAKLQVRGLEGWRAGGSGMHALAGACADQLLMWGMHGVVMGLRGRHVGLAWSVW